jgi:hypothetical protein
MEACLRELQTGFGERNGKTPGFRIQAPPKEKIRIMIKSRIRKPKATKKTKEWLSLRFGPLNVGKIRASQTKSNHIGVVFYFNPLTKTRFDLLSHFEQMHFDLKQQLESLILATRARHTRKRSWPALICG